ncbi:SOS response-associated peptidase family protein [Novilysobacter spongiicola]|uniref:Abasic site processing protein n=1 Tax=Lysobacter spongiicola DSM 21749 TaxID=1122188 RepID=A0A1T4RFA4_9GAMM|nr:SOS response-associated peptidase family protein [Lysobacter spongiicola]SKA14665.1 SOS response associated peptidase (SRAP) [Lysobacter spongiicola DSM 21749]
MCYSAQVWADYHRYVRVYGAEIAIDVFYDLYVRRRQGEKLKTPKSMDLAFRGGQSQLESQISAMVRDIHAAEISDLERELFKQTKRLADATRSLLTKQTKKALEEQRIAGNKIEQMKGRLRNLQRVDDQPSDSRIYPGMYAPVMVWEDGKRVVKPMRYQCRAQGKPAINDRKFPGTYNARRDNLEGFWKSQFGRTQGLMVAERFYENVETPDGNAVLEFVPRTGEPMLIACLWSRWTDPKGEEPDLWSFAAITDEPEEEVAAAGHDRTIINIKPEHIDAWLNPEQGNLDALYAILDDKQHPYYEHRIAA